MNVAAVPTTHVATAGSPQTAPPAGDQADRSGSCRRRLAITANTAWRRDGGGYREQSAFAGPERAHGESRHTAPVSEVGTKSARLRPRREYRRGLCQLPVSSHGKPAVRGPHPRLIARAPFPTTDPAPAFVAADRSWPHFPNADRVPARGSGVHARHRRGVARRRRDCLRSPGGGSSPMHLPASPTDRPSRCVHLVAHPQSSLLPGARAGGCRAWWRAAGGNASGRMPGSRQSLSTSLEDESCRNPRTGRRRKQSSKPLHLP